MWMTSNCTCWMLDGPSETCDLEACVCKIELWMSQDLFMVNASKD